MKASASTIKFIQEQEIKFLDFRFTDIEGGWRHITQPVSFLNNLNSEGNIPIDGSSIRGWKGAESSELLLKPDYSTLILDPFTTQNTAVVICSVIDPLTLEDYFLDVRSFAIKAEKYLLQNFKNENAFFGLKPEFFIFDEVSYKTGFAESFYKITSSENGQKTNADLPNLGHQIIKNGGYTSISPQDNLFDIRNEISGVMQECGLSPTSHSHQSFSGQCKLGIEKNTLLKAADNFQKYKYIVKNVVSSYGKTATFMPKPLYESRGSSLSIHISLTDGKVNSFAGGKYAGLSETALFYIGGIIKHMPALCAFACSTTNSYKRMQFGEEAASGIAYSAFNRSSAIRIPYAGNINEKRLSLQFADSASNPYILLPALLMAGLDGIKNKIIPPEPYERNLYSSHDVSINRLPSHLEEALMHLKKEGDFLLEGNIFTREFIKSYIQIKSEDAKNLNKTPNPIEFEMYYSV